MMFLNDNQLSDFVDKNCVVFPVDLEILGVILYREFFKKG